MSEEEATPVPDTYLYSLIRVEDGGRETLSTPLVDMMKIGTNWQVLKDTISTPTVGNQLPLSNPTDSIIPLFVVEIPSSALVENQMDH